MMAGNTSLATVPGTLSLRVPAGRSRKAFTPSTAVSTSFNAGTSRSKRRVPASVGATLRVVSQSEYDKWLNAREAVGAQ